MSLLPDDEIIGYTRETSVPVTGAQVLQAADFTTRAGLVDNQTLRNVTNVLNAEIFIKNDEPIRFSRSKESDR